MRRASRNRARHRVLDSHLQMTPRDAVPQVSRGGDVCCKHRCPHSASSLGFAKIDRHLPNIVHLSEAAPRRHAGHVVGDPRHDEILAAAICAQWTTLGTIPPSTASSEHLTARMGGQASDAIGMGRHRCASRSRGMLIPSSHKVTNQRTADLHTV